LLIVSGCTVTPTVRPPVPTDYQEHATVLSTLDEWALKGRAAITTASDSGTVALDWRQSGERYALELRAPWGAGTVQLNGGRLGVLLRSSKGQEEFAGDPGELLYRYTGYRLPLQALRYWLLGMPAPDTPADHQVDERGLVTQLLQHGWRVRYLAYGDYQGVALPTKMFLEGDDIEVRVAVQEWDIHR
jgi:outer membrane lipoprotein LolB